MNSSHPLTSRRPEETIAWTRRREIRVGDFLAQVDALAANLPDRDYVINLATDRYSFLVGFCAAIVAGQCTLLPPNRQKDTLRRLIDDYADCYAFGEAGIERVPGFAIDGDIAAISAPDAPNPAIPDKQICAILFTSGSTGPATPHPKPWRTLREGAYINETGYGLGDRHFSMLATVPPQHSWGLETSILLPLISPLAIAAQTPLFPEDVAQALAELPQPRVLVSSPIHLDALLRAEIRGIRIDRILSATAPMSADLARSLEDRFGARVNEIFGCSEAGSLAFRQTAEESDWHIMDAFDFEVAGDKVQVHGPHLYEQVTLNDRIELLADKRFRWLGRDQDMINIAGKRGSLAHLNHELNRISGIEDGVIFLPSENSKRLAALVVAPGLEPSAILESLKQVIEPAFLPRPLYKVTRLPRQETGKLARQTILQVFEDARSAVRDNGEKATGSG